MPIGFSGIPTIKLDGSLQLPLAAMLLYAASSTTSRGGTVHTVFCSTNMATQGATLTLATA
jgi:hypothetical protein